MSALPARRPFAVIGENIHATRSLLRSGRHIVHAASGEGVAFTDAAGRPRVMLLAEAIASSSELATGKVKHIRNALILAFGVELDGAPAATPAGADARVVGEVKPALERLVPQTAGKGLPGA